MQQPPFRIGYGMDFHRLESGRPLMIGGVEVPFERGATGHSDADVLLHAVCDALLGAAALGDIGLHFPDTAQEFKNIDSKILLERTTKLIVESGYVIGNIDATVNLEQPKISSYKDAMIRLIAQICGIADNQVSVKATTSEQMGFVGRGEGIAAYATALIFSNNTHSQSR